MDCKYIPLVKFLPLHKNILILIYLDKDYYFLLSIKCQQLNDLKSLKLCIGTSHPLSLGFYQVINR